MKARNNLGRSSLIFSLIVCSFSSAAAPAENQQKWNVIPSWGDVVCVYAQGIDAAMDSPQAFTNMYRHWKGRGFTGIYLRTDLDQIEPFVHRHPKEAQKNSRLAALWRRVDEVMESFDVHLVAQQLADEQNFEYWAWHPHIYSDGAPVDVGTPGIGRMIPWSYVSKYTYEHPETITIDRQGNRYWMVREFAYPGARKDKVGEFVYMAKAGLKRFIACMRSEATQLLDAPYMADQYGFNEPVVNDMKTLFGVDILTDPRFDVDSPDFNPRDPMVENWHNLRGTYVTAFFRDLRESLSAIDPKIKIAVTLSGEQVGPILGNWKMDWRTWVDEGLIDEIIAPTTFEATYDLELDKKDKGYLTDVRHGKGVVPYAAMRGYIQQSQHPEIKIIATGASAYFCPPPPAGSDGWRASVWYDLYHLAWYQRWEQLKKDLNDFGHIRFFDQHFDAFPVQGGNNAALGDYSYNPKTRNCPGLWYDLGDGRNENPVVQSDIVHGDAGHAIKLTRFENGKGTLSAWHSSEPDRSHYTGCIDPAISNGTCTFEFYIYCPDQESSLSAYIESSTPMERDVGLSIGPKGRLRYNDGGQWIDSSYVASPKQWHRLKIVVDFGKQAYSAYSGDEYQNELCSDIHFSTPESRFIEEHGVNIPIEVPSYRFFNQLLFVPEGTAGSVTYLDDVLVTWTPVLGFTQPGKVTYLADDFESHPAGGGIHDAPANTGGKWRVHSGKDNGFVVENGTSYGPGVHCIRATGESNLVIKSNQPLNLSDKQVVVVDFDIFVRSDKNYPYILPDPTTRSKHHTEILLNCDGASSPLTAISADNGIWRYWEQGAYVDSNVPIAYDVWNHVQLALDTKSLTCKIVVQPVGEMPRTVAQMARQRVAHADLTDDNKLSLSIRPSPTSGHISCYDNISVMY